MVQPLALQKAVMATPPASDTPISRRNDGSTSCHFRNSTQNGSSRTGIAQFQNEKRLVVSMKRFHVRSGMGLLFR